LPRLRKLLMIAGGSARWAAQSVRRSGWRVVAADHFVDQDLVAACDAAIRWDRSCHALLSLVKSSCPDAWCYLGGVENAPHLIESVTRHVPLRGSPARSVRSVRNISGWPVLVERAGWRTLQHRRELRLSDWEKGQWLLKPIRSCGGLAVRFATKTRRVAAPGWFFQEYWPGDPYAAAFLALEDGARLLGVTRQWTAGEPMGPAGMGGMGNCPPSCRFAYAGSIGPVAIEPTWARRLTRLGAVLSRETGLRGLFGVDFVARGDELRVVEINPRPTASMEVLECLGGGSWMALHLSAGEDRRRSSSEDRPPAAPGDRPWEAGGDRPSPVAGDRLRSEWSEDRPREPDGGDRPPGRPGDRRSGSCGDRRSSSCTTYGLFDLVENGRFCAKRIVYAPGPVPGAACAPVWADIEDRYGVSVRDIPDGADVIAAGRPVVTLVACGHSAEELEQRLAAALGELTERLRRPLSPP